MSHQTSNAIIVVTAIAALLLLFGEAGDPVLYSAENISSAAHADPATVPGMTAEGDTDALIPLMNDLMDQAGTLTLKIRLKDYDNAAKDLARYAEQAGQLERLVIDLDLSGTDIDEFKQNNQEDLVALEALLDDIRRFENLQKLEVQVQDDERHTTVAYEGEALQRKMQEGFSAYSRREDVTTRIAGRYGMNVSPYRESIKDFKTIVGTMGTQKTGDADDAISPLQIMPTPDEGRYGDTIQFTGTYTGGNPGTPITIYVDSRVAGNTSLDKDGKYSLSYQINRTPAGLRLAYATAGEVQSSVTAFEVLPSETEVTLAVEAGTPVICTGALSTIGDRSVMGAPILLRVDGTEVVKTETDQNGTYTGEIALSAGNHTIQAEFDAPEYALNASKSLAKDIVVQSEGLSPIPFVAAMAAALGSGWYLRRRHRSEEIASAPKAWEMRGPEVEEEEEVVSVPPQIEIAGLPPREAATVLFCAFRARLGLSDAKTPRDCARLSPDHVWFFECYEKIRYAGEIPTEGELWAMKAEVLVPHVGREDE